MVDFQGLSIGTSGTAKPAVRRISRVPARDSIREEQFQQLVILKRRGITRADPVSKSDAGCRIAATLPPALALVYQGGACRTSHNVLAPAEDPLTPFVFHAMETSKTRTTPCTHESPHGISRKG
jgi:hypothetical protein